jgi:hypothetical protein
MECVKRVHSVSNQRFLDLLMEESTYSSPKKTDTILYPSGMKDIRLHILAFGLQSYFSFPIDPGNRIDNSEILLMEFYQELRHSVLLVTMMFAQPAWSLMIGFIHCYLESHRMVLNRWNNRGAGHTCVCRLIIVILTKKIGSSALVRSEMGLTTSSTF